jgi:hypothetical protein
MKVARCRTCQQFKPAMEPHFSRYQGHRRGVKQICNACIDAAHEKRIRKNAAPSLDGRDMKHPLEEVIKEWRSSSACSSPSPDHLTPDTRCSSEESS